MDCRGIEGSPAGDRREADRIGRAAAGGVRKWRPGLARGAAGNRTDTGLVGFGGSCRFRTDAEVPECGQTNWRGETHSGPRAGCGNGAALLGAWHRVYLSRGPEALLVPGTYHPAVGHRRPDGFAVCCGQVRTVLGPAPASAARSRR